MTVSIRGVDKTKVELRRMAERTRRAELRLMDQYSEKIADRAKMYAPVDEGFLEDAIEVERERSGPRGRIVHKVGVNTQKLGPGYTERGHPYHIVMHEDPQNNSGNGPRSREKAAALGVMVGPKYMTRALEDYREEIDQAARAIAKKEAKG